MGLGEATNPYKMKSKLFLIIITASFSFAVYSLFNNIGKAKNELRNPATTAYIAEQQTEAAQQSTNAAKIKKQNSRRYSNYSNDVSNAPAVSFSKHKSGSLSESSLFDGSYTAQNVNSSAKRKRSFESSELSGGSSVIVSSYANGRRNGGSEQSGLLASASTASTSMSNPMSAPTDDGTIIIDPGTDPDPNTMIPVGNGMYVMMMLIGLYGAFAFYKRKLN